METGERPIANSCDQAVLDGVEMQIVHVVTPIEFVPDRVLPEARLPHLGTKP